LYQASEGMPIVTPNMRWELMGQTGVIVWLTGLSGSGKTTISRILDNSLHVRGMRSYVLDGDRLRKGLCRDLGFSAADRIENVRRAGEVACLLAEAGLFVICALISPFESERAEVRAKAQRAGIRFIEVYVNASLQVCEGRDPKGLYRLAREGKIPDFTGIDSPYQPPPSPEVELDSAGADADSCVKILLGEILRQ